MSAPATTSHRAAAHRGWAHSREDDSLGASEKNEPQGPTGGGPWGPEETKVAPAPLLLLPPAAAVELVVMRAEVVGVGAGLSPPPYRAMRCTEPCTMRAQDMVLVVFTISTWGLEERM